MRACSAPTSRSATGCTSPPTPARRGRTSGCATASRFRASPSIRRIPTVCSSRSSAIRTVRTRSAASSARPTAARPSRRSCTSDENTGGKDVDIDPSNPERRLRDDVEATAGPVGERRVGRHGGGVFKSTDGGDTWKQLHQRACPNPSATPRSAVAPSNPQRVYAYATRGSTAQAGGGAWRTGPGRRRRPDEQSDLSVGRRRRDVGAGDERHPRRHQQRGVDLHVDPTNADRLIVTSQRHLQVRPTAARSWLPFKGAPGGDDYQNAWINPDQHRHHDRRRRPGRGRCR